MTSIREAAKILVTAAILSLTATGSSADNLSLSIRLQATMQSFIEKNSAGVP